MPTIIFLIHKVDSDLNGFTLYSNPFDMDLILVKEDVVALVATSMETGYNSFLHISHLNGSPIVDYVFDLFLSLGNSKSFVKDIKTFDEETFYVLMYTHTSGLGINNTDTEYGSVILEANPFTNDPWKAIKITSANISNPYDLQLNKMFKWGCQRLLAGGNDNPYGNNFSSDSRVQFGEINTPLFGSMHPSPPEYVIANITYAPYTPQILLAAQSPIRLYIHVQMVRIHLH